MKFFKRNKKSIIEMFKELPTIEKKNILKELDYITFDSRESWEDYKFSKKDYAEFNKKFFSLSEILSSLSIDEDYLYKTFDTDKYDRRWVFLNTSSKEYYFGKENLLVCVGYVLDEGRSISDAIKYLEHKYNKFDFRLVGIWRNSKGKDKDE